MMSCEKYGWEGGVVREGRPCMSESLGKVCQDVVEVEVVYEGLFQVGAYGRRGG